MSKGQIIILDCHGETRPAICFNLEVAGYQVRVVTDDNEAINLLDNARLIEENYVGLLVNNPYLNVDISKIIEEVQKIDIEIPIIFIKDSENLKKIVEMLSREYKAPHIYHTEPTQTVNLLTRLSAQLCSEKNGGTTASQAV